MNQDQTAALARQILLLVCGGLVARGYMDDATLQIVVASLVALGTAGFGLYTRRAAGLIASAAAQPNVARIVTDRKTAVAVTSPKVVASGGV